MIKTNLKSLDKVLPWDVTFLSLPHGENTVFFCFFIGWLYGRGICWPVLWNSKKWNIHLLSWHSLGQSKNKWLCYSTWSFHLHGAVKNRAFFLVFPLAGSTAKAFSGYPFGVSRKTASIIFYNTAKRINFWQLLL